MSKQLTYPTILKQWMSYWWDTTYYKTFAIDIFNDRDIVYNILRKNSFYSKSIYDKIQKFLKKRKRLKYLEKHESKKIESNIRF